jgi:hypothetical protein
LSVFGGAPDESIVTGDRAGTRSPVRSWLATASAAHAQGYRRGTRRWNECVIAAGDAGAQHSECRLAPELSGSHGETWVPPSSAAGCLVTVMFTASEAPEWPKRLISRRHSQWAFLRPRMARFWRAGRARARPCASRQQRVPQSRSYPIPESVSSAACSPISSAGLGATRAEWPGPDH